MTTEEIYTQLVPIVKTNLLDDMDAISIIAESELTRELNINTAHIVDMILDVEEAFDMELDHTDMESLSTLNDTMAIIKQKIG